MFLDLTNDKKEARTANRRLAQWRVKWLIEHLPDGRQVLP